MMKKRMMTTSSKQYKRIEKKRKGISYCRRSIQDLKTANAELGKPIQHFALLR